ncbi:kelch-like protein 20 isoform X2 [Paramacrobiotus metropolitanus]|uniref:kelch-like protein 20 isoform X2 n=1 Tax=Paramacrobiotus metropolitanus TaxID=2943436 RepID=UPI002446286D|nr:kelch-like protein 20 isoform X2 [Paramacrobiotus metropolitanus]
MVLLVMYAYTMDLSLSDDNVVPVLIAAQFLQMTPVARLCWAYLEKHMSLSNCLTVHALASQHHNPRLSHTALALIHPNFLRLAQSQDFLQMDAQQLTALIASDEVEVFSEDEVLEAVLRWLDYDRARRLAHVPTVLHSVRAIFLSVPSRQEYDEALAGAPTGMPPCPSGMFGEWTGGMTLNTTPRPSFGAQEVIVCVGGGDDNEDGATVEVFNPLIPAVWRLKELDMFADCLNAVMMDDRWMMISSMRGLKTVKRNSRYTGLRGKWGPPVADMQTLRHSEGLAALNGRVYAAGGYIPFGDPVSSVEAYDFKSNSWSAVAALPVGVMGLEIVTWNGKLYAFGGEIEEGNGSSLALAYDPEADNWARLADMPTARYGCAACVAPSGLIYVVGGELNDQYSALVEAYNPVTNQWQRKGDLVQPRWLPGCISLDGKLFVLGGAGPKGVERDTIEVYDPDADCWKLHECRLSSGNFGFGCVKMKLKSA